MTKDILIAGFGGQGVLFAGKALAKMAMNSEYEVTWLPSYGPEMRGGAANCSVIISDDVIGSPLVPAPDILIAMNRPSFDKFEPRIKPGGTLFADSSMIDVASSRTDIDAFYIPASRMASENGLSRFANVIMLGFMIAKTSLFDYDEFLSDLVYEITRDDLAEGNHRALSLGYNYQEK